LKTADQYRYPNEIIMRPPGSFKLLGRQRRGLEGAVHTDPYAMMSGREMRIVESLRTQILEGGDDQNLRIRQVLDGPRAIYRIEIEVPEMAYLRTTLLDGDALEELLAHDEVRCLVDAQLG
jgi:hypothetical protein